MDLLQTLCSTDPFVSSLIGASGAKPVNVRVPQKFSVPKPKQTKDAFVRSREKRVQAKHPQKAVSNKPAVSVAGVTEAEKALKRRQDWEFVKSLHVDFPDRKEELAPGRWKTIRVFISSTFVDMQGERDVLIKEVFPEVNNRLKDRFVRIVPVDLRWGVTHSDPLNVQTTCLDEIDRCRAHPGELPWVIALRGNRLGWMQTEYQYPSKFATPQNVAWIENMEKHHRHMSITSMEIYHAFLGHEDSTPHRSPHAFVAFRDSHDLMRQVPGPDKWVFEFEYKEPKMKDRVDAVVRPQYHYTPRAVDYLKDFADLNAAIRSSSGAISFDYSCSFDRVEVTGRTDTGKLMATGYVKDLEKFRDFFIEKLTQSLCAEYPLHGSLDALAKERAQHLALAESRAELFVGQEGLLSQLISYCETGEDEQAHIQEAGALFASKRRNAGGDEEKEKEEDPEENKDNSGDEQGVPMFVLNGEPGSGKSAVLARFCQVFEQFIGAQRPTQDDEVESENNTILIWHLVSASDGSERIQNLLLRVCRELQSRCSTLSSREIPEADFGKLKKEWVQFVRVAALSHKIVILVDGLDQLITTSTANQALDLSWLPSILPWGARLIVSTSPISRDVDVISNILSRHPNALVVENPVLPASQLESLVTTFLAKFHKKLTNTDDPILGNQNQMLMSKSSSQSPLYLVVAADCLRRYGVYEKLSQYINELPDNTPDLFDHVITSLLHDNGDIVRWVLSLIAVSRSGLLESELIEILDTVPLGKESSNWSRLSSTLSSLLSGGSGFLKFFHNELLAVVCHYFSVGADHQHDASHISTNEKLAKYFMTVVEKELAGIEQCNGDHAFSELVYHLVEANQMEIAKKKCFLRMDWLYFRMKFGSVDSLILDMNSYLEKVPSDRAICLLRDAVVLSSSAISIDYRQLSFQLATRLEGCRFPELHVLLSEQSWQHATHPTNPLLTGLTKPGGAGILRVNKARLPVGVAAGKPDFCFTFETDGRIGVISLENGSRVFELSGHTAQCYHVEMLPVSATDPRRRCISYGMDQTVTVWDLDAALAGQLSETIVGNLDYGEGRISECQFICYPRHPEPNSITGVLLIVGKTIVMWDFTGQTGAAHVVLSNHSDRILGVLPLPSEDPDELRALSWSEDNSLILWNLNDVESYTQLKGHSHWVKGVRVVDGGKKAVSFSRDSSLALWDLTPPEPEENRMRDPMQRLKGHASPVMGIEVFGEDLTAHTVSVFSWDQTRELFLWDLDLTVDRSLAGRQKNPNPTPLSAEMKDGEQTCRCVRLRSHFDAVSGVIILPEGKEAISYGRDRNMMLWNIPALKTSANLSASLVSYYGDAVPKPMSNNAMRKSEEDKKKKKGQRKKRGRGKSKAKPVAGSDAEAKEKEATKLKAKKVANAKAYKIRQKQKEKKKVKGGSSEDASNDMLNRSVKKKKTRVFRPRDPNAIVMKGHGDWVLGARLFANNTKLVSFSRDTTLIVWDLAAVREGQKHHYIKLRNGHIDWVRDVAVFSETAGGVGVPSTTEDGDSFSFRSLSAAPPSERWKMVSCGGNELILWDLDGIESGQLNAVIRLKGHSTRVSSVVVYDGVGDNGTASKRALSVANNTIMEWDLSIAEAEAKYANTAVVPLGHTKWITGAKMFPQGGRVLTWGKDNTLVARNLMNFASQDPNENLVILKGHKDFVRSAEIVAEGSKVLSWSKDKKIILWDLELAQQGKAKCSTVVGAENGHRDIVLGLRLFDEERKAFSFSRDKTLCVWDLSNKKFPNYKFEGHSKWIRGATIVANSQDAAQQFLLSWSDDGTMKIWKLTEALAKLGAAETGKAWATLNGHTDKIFGTTTVISVLPSSIQDATPSSEAVAESDTKAEGDDSEEADQPREKPAAGSHQNRPKLPMHLVSYAADNTIRIWDIDRATIGGEITPIQTLTGHTDWVIGATPIRQRGVNKRMLLSWSRDGSVRVWDLDADSRPVTKDQPAVVSFAAHRGPVKGMRLSRNQAMLFTWGQEDNKLIMWNMHDVTKAFRPLVRKAPPKNPESRSTFGSSLFASSDDTGSQPKKPTIPHFATKVSLVGHRTPVNKLTLFAEETRLVSSCSFSVIVWDLTTRPTPTRLWTATFDHSITAIFPTLSSSSPVLKTLSDSFTASTDKSDKRSKAKKPYAKKQSGKKQSSAPLLSKPRGAPAEQTLTHLFLGHADGQVSQLRVLPIESAQERAERLSRKVRMGFRSIEA